MKFRHAALALSLLMASPSGAAWARSSDSAIPVVVELFTSQGCSDCPPADRLVTELATRRDVIALSLPITYWDMLGWKDTLATEANTQRQRAYAKAMNRSGIYTPQMIIGGIEDVVGNRRDEVMAAIAAQAAREKPERHVSVDVSQSSDYVTIAISGEKQRRDRPEISATIWVMRTLGRAAVTVGGGENGNRELVYTNVVRDLQRAGSWYGGSQTMTLPISNEPGRRDGIAVILQDHDYGRVIGAAFTGARNRDANH